MLNIIGNIESMTSEAIILGIMLEPGMNDIIE